MSAVEIGSIEKTERAQRRLRFFRRYMLAIVGGAIVLAWAMVAVLAPWIAPHLYSAVSLPDRLIAPGWAHPFGTDELGRDVLSRVIYGARISLPTGIAVVFLGGVVGTAYGALAAFAGPRVDGAMMRITDLFLCFPPLILAMAIAAALGVGWGNTILAMVVVWWPKYARVSRSLVLVQRSQDYVDAARALGYDRGRIVFRHILPNTLGPLVTLLTLDIGNAIITFAGLSFLGLGVVPPTPEWGAMVSEGRTLIKEWWVSAFPGLAIFSVCLGFNFLGDGIRDWLDPRARQR
jgi:peptide/nickel transport system permease protein